LGAGGGQEKGYCSPGYSLGEVNSTLQIFRSRRRPGEGILLSRLQFRGGKFHPTNIQGQEAGRRRNIALQTTVQVRSIPTYEYLGAGGG